MSAPYHAARRAVPRPGDGQSLVEFALVLPTVLIVAFVIVQMILLLRADNAVQDLAHQIAVQVAFSGGETASVDTGVPQMASAAGLSPASLVVQVTTQAPDGSVQSGDAHGATSLPAHPAPAGAYAGTVTVMLRYTYAAELPLLSQRAFVLSAQSTLLNTAFGGESP